MTTMHSLLTNILGNPTITAEEKRGVAMLLQSAEQAVKPVSYSAEEHLNDALNVMSDADYAALRKDMGEIADAMAAFIGARDKLAALANKWGTDAIDLSEAESAVREKMVVLQNVVRREYAERYIP